MKIGDLEYPSLKGKVSDEEWATRVELAALYRLLPIVGLWDLSQPPATAAVPGEPGHFLVNPLGFLFDEITASSLVKITLDGEYAAETPLTFSRRIWYPMQAVHAARPDAKFVLHLHDPVITALAARKDRLLPISQIAAFMLAGGIAYHDYDGIETYEERMASLQKSLGDSYAMILLNHGLVTVGPSAYSVLGSANSIKQACQIQLLAGHERDVQPIAAEILPQFAQELRSGVAVDHLWAGLLRRLDRLDPSYKD